MFNYKKSKTVADRGKEIAELKLQITGFGQQELISTGEIVAFIDKLPSFHLQKLTEITYDPQRLIPKIIQSGMEDMADNVKGVFIQSQRMIAVFEIESRELFFHTLLHELGHHVYFLVIGQQLKKTWVTEICRNDKFITKYASRNAAEDFAESYVAYLRKPERLEKIPLKYNFLRKHVFHGVSPREQGTRLDIYG